MYIKQIYTSSISQASYFIESQGVAAVIDPIRDTEVYLKLAKERNATIQYVLETHFHADFVSGHLELAEKTGAVIIFGPTAKPAFKAMVAKDGNTVNLGKIKIKLIHTPGHTLESSCFLAYNEEDHPYVVFTGDTLFVGDVGRPDLGSGNLGKEALASMLYDSLNKLISGLPDSVIIYPGHGAGSACGKSLGKETWSTVGVQKNKNYALQPMNRELFIKKVIEDLPAPPPYFSHDVNANKNGYEMLETVIQKAIMPLNLEDFRAEMNKGAVVLDVRNSTEFGIGFIKGSLNIGLDGAFAVWVGNLIPADKPIVLVVNEQKERDAVIRLARIGFDNVKGYQKDNLMGWIKAQYTLDHVETISEHQLELYLDEGYIPLDVRTAAEASENRIKHSLNIPLEVLPQQLAQLNSASKYLIYCAGGYRSMIAASILKGKGFTNVANVRGGIAQVKKEMPSLVETIESKSRIIK